MEKMTEYEKLEYIHSYLQEVENGNADCGMLPHAIAFVEDIREKHFDKNGDLIKWNKKLKMSLHS